MKLSQKKNCNGCKGGYYDSQPFRQICSLGFSVKSKNYTGIPQEPCYKPLTNKKAVEAHFIIFPRSK